MCLSLLIKTNFKAIFFHIIILFITRNNYNKYYKYAFKKESNYKFFQLVFSSVTILVILNKELKSAI